MYLIPDLGDCNVCVISSDDIWYWMRLVMYVCTDLGVSWGPSRHWVPNKIGPPPQFQVLEIDRSYNLPKSIHSPYITPAFTEICCCHSLLLWTRSFTDFHQNTLKYQLLVQVTFLKISAWQRKFKLQQHSCPLGLTPGKALRPITSSPYSTAYFLNRLSLSFKEKKTHNALILLYRTT